MIVSLILIFGALLALWLARDGLKRAAPGALNRLGVWLGLAALVVVGIWLVATGKLAGLLAIGAGLAPWIGRAMRLHALWRWVSGLRRPTKPPPASSPPSPPASAMSADEARAVLGVGPDADSDAIRAAHRRLMQANHPDHGGSTWIAARLNQARDVLLG
jgi:DnaJ family protein C protein 19